MRPWDNRKKEQSMKAKQSSYDCEICGNKYSTKYILKKHVWNVHEDRKTHQCQNCENSFKTASGLEYHIKVVHHGGKENYCAICDIEFQVIFFFPDFLIYQYFLICYFDFTKFFSG